MTSPRRLRSTTETTEEIPARDGRILSADGRVLADLGTSSSSTSRSTIPRFEDPPDDEWITAKAKPRLGKADRRDKAKLAAEKQKVISEHESSGSETGRTAHGTFAG